MVSKSPSQVIEDNKGKSLATIVTSGLGGIVMMVALTVSNVVKETGEVLSSPADQLGIELSDWVKELFGVPVDILGAGGRSAVQSLEPGGMFFMGPLTYPIAILTVLSGFYLVAQYLARTDTGDLIPGSVTDYFGAGADEADKQ